MPRKKQTRKQEQKQEQELPLPWWTVFAEENIDKAKSVIENEKLTFIEVGKALQESATSLDFPAEAVKFFQQIYTMLPEESASKKKLLQGFMKALLDIVRNESVEEKERKFNLIRLFSILRIEEVIRLTVSTLESGFKEPAVTIISYAFSHIMHEAIKVQSEDEVKAYIGLLGEKGDKITAAQLSSTLFYRVILCSDFRATATLIEIFESLDYDFLPIIWQSLVRFLDQPIDTQAVESQKRNNIQQLSNILLEKKADKIIFQILYEAIKIELNLISNNFFSNERIISNLNLKEMLNKAILEESPEIVGKFLEKYKEFNVPIALEEVLYFAASKKKYAIVLFMVKQGVKIVYKGESSPFELAVQSGYTALVRIFLEQAQKENEPLCSLINWKKCLYSMVTKKEEKYLDILKVLLESLDPEAEAICRQCFCLKTERGATTLLHLAVSNGNVRMALEFLKRFPEYVNTIDASGRTPLHIAAQRGNEYMTSVLLEFGADASMQIQNNKISENVLEENRDSDIEKTIFEATKEYFDFWSEQNTDSHIGKTAFEIAKRAFDFSNKTKLEYGYVCEVLSTEPVSRSERFLGAFIENKGRKNEDILELFPYILPKLPEGSLVNLLYSALKNGRARILIALLEHRPPIIDIPCKEEGTVLHWAVSARNVPVINMLLKKGANITIGYMRNGVCITPLDSAICQKDPTIIIIILEHLVAAQNITVKEKSELIENSLNLEIASNFFAKNLEVPLNLLLKYYGQCSVQPEQSGLKDVLSLAAGCEAKTKNPAYMTAVKALLKWYKEKKTTPPNIIEILTDVENKGATSGLLCTLIHAAQPKDRVHLAIRYKQSQLIPEFLNKDIRYLEQKDELLRTPLHLASELGQVKTVKMLLDHGADTSIPNAEGRIAIEIARNLKHKTIVGMLEEFENKKTLQPILLALSPVFERLHFKPEETRVDDKNKVTLSFRNSEQARKFFEFLRCYFSKDVQATLSQYTVNFPWFSLINRIFEEPVLKESNKRVYKIIDFLYKECEFKSKTVCYEIREGQCYYTIQYEGYKTQYEKLKNMVLKINELSPNAIQYNDKDHTILFSVNAFEVNDAVFNQILGVKIHSVRIHQSTPADCKKSKKEDRELAEVLKKSLQKEYEEQKKQKEQKEQEDLERKWKSSMQQGDFKHLQIWLKKGIDVNLADERGRTALYYAAMFGNLEAMITLIKYRANIDQPDENEDTPLRIAVKNSDDIEVIRQLLAYGANVNWKNKDENSPLHAAAARGAVAIAALLIDEGAEVDAQTKRKNTPLHAATACREAGAAEVMTLLADRGADLNAENIDGNTPLHIAVRNNAVDKIKILVMRDAATNIPNKKEETVIQLASKKNLIIQKADFLAQEHEEKRDKGKEEDVESLDPTPSDENELPFTIIGKAARHPKQLKLPQTPTPSSKKQMMGVGGTQGLKDAVHHLSTLTKPEFKQAKTWMHFKVVESDSDPQPGEIQIVDVEGKPICFILDETNTPHKIELPHYQDWRHLHPGVLTWKILGISLKSEYCPISAWDLAVFRHIVQGLIHILIIAQNQGLRKTNLERLRNRVVHNRLSDDEKSNELIFYRQEQLVELAIAVIKFRVPNNSKQLSEQIDKIVGIFNRCEPMKMIVADLRSLQLNRIEFNLRRLEKCFDTFLKLNAKSPKAAFAFGATSEPTLISAIHEAVFQIGEAYARFLDIESDDLPFSGQQIKYLREAMIARNKERHEGDKSAEQEIACVYEPNSPLDIFELSQNLNRCFSGWRVSQPKIVSTHHYRDSLYYKDGGHPPSGQPPHSGASSSNSGSQGVVLANNS